MIPGDSQLNSSRKPQKLSNKNVFAIRSFIYLNINTLRQPLLFAIFWNTNNEGVMDGSYKGDHYIVDEVLYVVGNAHVYSF